MINLEDELAKDYLAECHEQLVALEADLLSMESGRRGGGSGRRKLRVSDCSLAPGRSGCFHLVRTRRSGAGRWRTRWS